MPEPVIPANRARILCALGPASSSPATLRAMVEAGMSVARLNFAHGDHQAHRLLFERVRAAADEADRAVAVMADLQGPKIRLGTFRGGSARLEAGAGFTLTTEAVEGDATIASTNYAALAREVRPGDPLLVDDGRVRLEALSSDGVRVACRVVEGGTVADRKGLNLPGVRLGVPSLTAKDRDDLRFALALGVDLVALSFVRDPADAEDVRRAMDACGRRVPVFAKIEKPEAVSRLEEIADAFDGLIVARGDLGVEIPLEEVPLVQKRAIRVARARARPAYVATQMLESMIESTRPTRAEASDVANAVLDGADAVMLSGETSVGRHPVETVATMRRIVAAIEAGGAPPPGGDAGLPGPARISIPAAVAAAAARTARDLGARALVAFTRSGATARLLAAHREPVALLAFTSDPGVRRTLAGVWGIESFVVEEVGGTDEMVVRVDRAIRERGLGRDGDLVVIVAGTPPGVTGSTNALRVHRVGDR